MYQGLVNRLILRCLAQWLDGKISDFSIPSKLGNKKLLEKYIQTIGICCCSTSCFKLTFSIYTIALPTSWTCLISK